jgi:hypothetical protein
MPQVLDSFSRLVLKTLSGLDFLFAGNLDSNSPVTDSTNPEARIIAKPEVDPQELPEKQPNSPNANLLAKTRAWRNANEVSQGQLASPGTRGL